MPCSMGLRKQVRKQTAEEEIRDLILSDMCHRLLCHGHTKILEPSSDADGSAQDPDADAISH